MLNYIKSELYRITHSVALYVLMLGFAVAPLLFNLMLFVFNVSKPGFTYSTTSFSYSNIVANPMFFCIAALILVFALYEGNKKNGNFRNIVASGISREQIFVGQFVVCFISSIVVMTISVAIYILSAEALLRKTGPVSFMDLFNEVFAVTPTAVSALILAIVVIMLFDKTFWGIISWYSILFLIPQLIFYLSLKIESLREIAMWMPNNFFNGMEVNTIQSNPIWNTSSGLATCLIAGFIGIIIFSILGIVTVRKKEL